MSDSSVPTDKREAVRRAALDVFVEHGFFGAVMPDIASRAHVGAGTIYRYFESKEALVNDIYREEKLRFARFVLEAFPSEAAAREQFRHVFMRMAHFATESRQAFVFLELHHHADYLDAESRAAEQQMVEMLTRVVEVAQQRGELREGPPRLLMSLVVGGFLGVMRNALEVKQPPLESDWVLAEQCMWEAVRAKREIA